MTIEERAKAYAEDRVNQMFCIPEEMPTEKQKANMMKGHEMTYIKIATEQKAIDKKLIYNIIEETVGFVRRQYPYAEDSDYAEVVYKAKEHIEDVYKEMRED